MRTDLYGQLVLSENDLCDLFLRDPTRNIKQVLIDKHIDLSQHFLSTENLPKLIEYTNPKVSVEEFDKKNQSNWYMPKEYLELDIAQWVLDKCNGEAELQRAGDELIRFQEREMFNLLRYLKYLVDTMRANGIVWGVGRGSSCASFVLYLIGIHKINSLYFQLDIGEFLR